jgi:hypothetical protein
MTPPEKYVYSLQAENEELALRKGFIKWLRLMWPDLQSESGDAGAEGDKVWLLKMIDLMTTQHESLINLARLFDKSCVAL